MSRKKKEDPTQIYHDLVKLRIDRYGKDELFLYKPGSDPFPDFETKPEKKEKKKEDLSAQSPF